MSVVEAVTFQFRNGERVTAYLDPQEADRVRTEVRSYLVGHGRVAVVTCVSETAHGSTHVLVRMAELQSLQCFVRRVSS